MNDIELAIQLLTVAKCPNCDGSGAVQVQTHSRQYISREMAMDVGDPSLEGSLYCDDNFDVEQCQWCDERKQLIDKYERQKQTELGTDGNQVSF